MASLLKKTNTKTELDVVDRKSDQSIKIMLSQCGAAIHWLRNIGNHSSSIKPNNTYDQRYLIFNESIDIHKNILKSDKNSLSPVSCSSNFDDKNKYFAEVAIEMIIDFENKSAAINNRYYADFKKISAFFLCCQKIEVMFEGYEIGNKVFNNNPLAQLRFKNVAKYLFDNFEVSPLLFYPRTSDPIIRRKDKIDNLDLQNHYQIKFLFSYQHISASRYLFD